jgi:hypothetical protein
MTPLTSIADSLARAAAVALLAGALVATAGAAPASAQNQPAPGNGTPAAQAPAQHDDHQASSDPREYPTLKIAGFGDINFLATHKPEGARGFTEGQFVLHMASELSPRVTFFGELSFTPRTDAGTGMPAAAGFNTEVERMILRFDQSDKLKVSFGRYHTPINYWNTAFHHGQWLQTTATRPEMIQFGGKLLPVHFVGGLVEGAVPAHGLNLHYQAGVGNGRSSVISRGGDAGDINGNRASLATVFVKPDGLFGLQAGMSAYFDQVTLSTGRQFQERIVSAHAVWLKEDPEIIAEFAGIRHREAGAALVTWSHAYYVQAAYRLPQSGRLWKPYYRFEHIGIPTADAVFTGIPLLDGSTVGVRYDASTFAAIKGEFRSWTRGAAVPRNYGGFFQLCFTF